MRNLKENFTIGILGGGQLAAMSAYQAYRFGFDVRAFTAENKYEPLDRLTNSIFKGDPAQLDQLIEFAKGCDVVTLENEFLDADLLIEAESASSVPFIPNPEAFKKVETKVGEKLNFERAGIPVPPWKSIYSTEDAHSFGRDYGYPFIIKSSKGGYDGYGNETVYSSQEIDRAVATLQQGEARELIGEGFISFRKELAVQVARTDSQTVSYPCCETIQENHICKEVIAPANLPEEISNQAIVLSRKALEAIDGYGLWAFEFFLTDKNLLLLNECAPRPHNSGHYTIEACNTSQFENHIRSICGLPLGDTTMRSATAVMINLLGTRSDNTELTNIRELFEQSGGHLHLYGKKQSRPGRKMGHYTLLGDDYNGILQRAHQLTDTLEI